LRIFFIKGTLCGSGQKVPGSKKGWLLIYCMSKVCLGIVGSGPISSCWFKPQLYTSNFWPRIDCRGWVGGVMIILRTFPELVGRSVQNLVVIGPQFGREKVGTNSHFYRRLFVPMSLFHARTAGPISPNFVQTTTPTKERFLTQVWPRQLNTLTPGNPKLQNLSRLQEKKLCFT